MASQSPLQKILSEKRKLFTEYQKNIENIQKLEDRNDIIGPKIAQLQKLAREIRNP